MPGARGRGPRPRETTAVDDPEQRVLLGRVSGPYGVRGWVRVQSDTEPPERIVAYSPWHLRSDGSTTVVEVLEGRAHGRGVVARLAGVADRDAARRLAGAEISVQREQLPALEEGEHYWADLIGLRVVTLAGRDLGRVTALMETGANDVLVVTGERERLVPYLPDRVVREVDLEAGRISVDWDPEL